MKKTAVLLILVVMLCSCAGIDNIKNTIDMSELELSADYEMLDMRLVFAHSETERTSSTTSFDQTTQQSQTTTTTTSSENPSHPLCINIGNSICVDLNGNVFLSVLDFYGLNDVKNWEIEYRLDGLNGYRIASRNNDVVNYKDNQALIKLNDEAEINDNYIKRTTGKFEREIHLSDDEYAYESNLSLFDRDRSIKIIDKNELSVGKTTITKKGDEIVFVDKANNTATRIFNNEGIIEIYNNIKVMLFFNKEILATKIARIDEGFVVFNRNSLGGYDRKVIHIEKNRMEYKRGFLTTYFEIK